MPKLKIVVVAIVLFLNSCMDIERANVFHKKIQNMECRGVIHEKYIDNNNRGQCTIELTNGTKYVIYNNLIFEIIKPGDSLIKNKGTLKHLLINSDTTIVFYPMTNNIPVTDSI